MREIINFSTKFESLEKVNPLITKYRINICVPDKPAKKYVFSKSIIEGMSNTIKGAGVYAYYFEKEQQLGGHEDNVVKVGGYGYKRTGKPVAYGFADPYQEPYWMEKDGEQWFTADVYMWTGRNPHIEEALQNPVWQSMEVAVDDEEDEYGNKIVKDAMFLGFCLLQGIQPVFEGSKIEKMSLPVTDNEIDLLKQEYESFISMSKEGDIVIKKAVEKFALNSNQIKDILSNTLSVYKYKQGDYEYCKYWVNCYDDVFVYVEDGEDYKLYRMKYDIADKVATIDVESKEEVIRGNYIPISQKSEQTSKEIKTEEMSSNEHVDNTAMQKLNDKAAEENKELSMEQMESEDEKDEKDEIIAGFKEEVCTMQDEMKKMKEKMSEMESNMITYSEENAKLKEFKSSIEKQNKEFSVETTLKDVINILPKEEIDAFRVSSENFSLENINAWKNEVKAKAFNFSKNISDKKPFIQVGLPVSNKPKRGTGLWD